MENKYLEKIAGFGKAFTRYNNGPGIVSTALGTSKYSKNISSLDSRIKGLQKIKGSSWRDLSSANEEVIGRTSDDINKSLRNRKSKLNRHIDIQGLIDKAEFKKDRLNTAHTLAVSGARKTLGASAITGSSLIGSGVYFSDKDNFKLK